MNAVDIQTPKIVAISMSGNPDMAVLGFSDDHLREAVAEFAIYLLASGANLAYGGDLRSGGLTELLFELATRYRREDSGARVIDYLAWPVHLRMKAADLDALAAELRGSHSLPSSDGMVGGCQWKDRHAVPPHEPDDREWGTGLTAMRKTMRGETDVESCLAGG